MINWDGFNNLPLRGGFTIVWIKLSDDPMLDAIGRQAIARTSIIGRQFSITVRSDIADEEFSVTIYHEILEAMTVASVVPPITVRNFNEGDFERAAYQAHKEFGEASPENLDRMLQFYRF